MCGLADPFGICELSRNLCCYIFLFLFFGWFGKGLYNFYGEDVDIAAELRQGSFWTPDLTFWMMGFSLLALLLGSCCFIKFIFYGLEKCFTILTKEKKSSIKDEELGIY